jgi:hypothetical protein
MSTADPPTAAARARHHLTPQRLVVFGAMLESTILVFCASRLWFFCDDWDFLLHRAVVGHADRGLFAPHYGHWSTSPILIFRAIFDVVGLSHYLPYALPVTCVTRRSACCSSRCFAARGCRNGS